MVEDTTIELLWALRNWVDATELETLGAEADTTDCEPALLDDTEAEFVR